jgi:hypothetical protein
MNKRRAMIVGSILLGIGFLGLCGGVLLYSAGSALRQSAPSAATTPDMINQLSQARSLQQFGMLAGAAACLIPGGIGFLVLLIAFITGGRQTTATPPSLSIPSASTPPMAPTIDPNAPASIVPGPNNSWTCSSCGGYVRHDATFCKHCKLPFHAPTAGT